MSKYGTGRKTEQGTHGGNRAGGRTKVSNDQIRKSSQAAGKDPHRGES
jgi:hypothetical protein